MLRKVAEGKLADASMAMCAICGKPIKRYDADTWETYQATMMLHGGQVAGEKIHWGRQRQYFCCEAHARRRFGKH